MALITKITRSIVDYTVLTLVDSTGSYDVVTNPTGWGTPNIELSEVLFAHLVITAPDLTIYDIDIINDLGIDYATAVAENLVYSIPSSLLGHLAGEILIDGTYLVNYMISSNPAWGEVPGADYLNNSLVPSYFTVQAAVFENIATIPNLISCNKNQTNAIKDINTQFLMLQALIYASSFAYLNEFTTILTTLQQILSFDLAKVSNS